MKSYIMAVLAVALFGAIVTEQVEAGEKGKQGKGNMMCLGEPIDKKAMNTGAKECKKELKGSSVGGDDEGGKKGKGQKGKKMMCMKVCMWKKQGILNADGGYVSDGAAAHIKTFIPAKAVDPVLAAMNFCASKIEDSATRMENDCAGYKKFKQCLMRDALGVACGNEKRKGKKGKGKGNKDNNKGEGSGDQDDNEMMNGI